MKLKPKLDPTALKRGIVENFEKLIFALVVLVFLMMVYGSFARERLNWGPSELTSLASQADQRITKAEEAWDPKAKVEMKDYDSIAEQIRRPVNLIAISNDWGAGLPDGIKGDKRRQPEVFPVADLRASAGVGAFAMVDPDAPPTTPAAAAAAARRAGYGSEYGESSGASTMPSKGLRYVVVTGLIPHRLYLDEYQEKFLQCAYRDPVRDLPDYAYYRLERAEVDPTNPAAEPKWVKLQPKTALNILQYWRAAPSGRVELAPPRCIPFSRYGYAFAFPLGPLLSGSWGQEVVHDPEVPVFDPTAALMNPAQLTAAQPGAAPMAKPAAKPGTASETEEPTAPNAFAPTAMPGSSEGSEYSSSSSYGSSPYGSSPGYGSSPYGSSSGYGSSSYGSSSSGYGSSPYGYGSSSEGSSYSSEGMGQQLAMLPPEYMLFRYFDFEVEEGKQYQYRVQLVLTNPNFSLPPQYVEDFDKTKVGFLDADWSEPSPVVEVPRDSRVLTVASKPSPVDPSATVMVVRFRQKDGQFANEEIDVQRGQLMNYLNREVKVPKPVGPEGSSYGSPEGYGYGPPSSYGPPGSSGAPMPKGVKPPEPQKVDYLTEVVLADASGGAKLPGKEALTEPGRLLLIDPNGILTVRNELEDYSLVMHYKPPEPPKVQSMYESSSSEEYSYEGSSSSEEYGRPKKKPLRKLPGSK